MIIVLLIVLTIIFEIMKEFIVEIASKNLRPIIESLFGEMTVLGFLSIITFLVTKFGYIQTLSAKLFGELEDEALLETFGTLIKILRELVSAVSLSLSLSFTQHGFPLLCH